MGSAYAFYRSASPACMPVSATGLARSNRAIEYRLAYRNFRVAELAQIGGYDQGNGSASMWQGQIGGDFNLFGGILIA